MTLYLDVAVVRIQSWLLRAPHLRGRRGASTMIRQATEEPAVKAMLTEISHLAERNDKAGHIDGVVPLKLTCTDDDNVATVENHVVRHLRKKLPSASLMSKLFEGDDTIAAHASLATFEHEWPPSVSEWVLGKQCDWCRSWPASKPATDNNETVELCTDCLLRHRSYAGRSTADPNGPQQPGTERDLIKEWERESAARARVPDYLDTLAKLGKSGDNTHLATIHADGNAVGLLTSKLRESQQQGIATDFDLPRAIANATWSGLLTAVARMNRTVPGAGDPETLPIIAHLVGGDDILVSVPAHEAWSFLDSMQTAFAESMHAGLVPAGLHEHSPTLSASVVFHHRTSQLSAAVDLAGELLDGAKSQHRGKRAAVAWQDITHDGPHVIARPSIALDTLKKYWPALEALANMGGSTLATLGKLDRGNTPDTPQKLRDHADRLGIRSDVEPFMTGEGPNVSDAVGMVRWWK